MNGFAFKILKCLSKIESKSLKRKTKTLEKISRLKITHWSGASTKGSILESQKAECRGNRAAFAGDQRSAIASRPSSDQFVARRQKVSFGYAPDYGTFFCYYVWELSQDFQPDFTLFGHLATSYYMPFRQPVTDMLDDEFTNLRQFLERMRTHYWPKWERSGKN